MSVDSPALLLTTPDRRPPPGQPIFNIHWIETLLFFVPEEDAPRRRGTVRTSNMNPKNIGLYKEGKGEEEQSGTKAKTGRRTLEEKGWSS